MDEIARPGTRRNYRKIRKVIEVTTVDGNSLKGLLVNRYGLPNDDAKRPTFRYMDAAEWKWTVEEAREDLNREAKELYERRKKQVEAQRVLASAREKLRRAGLTEAELDLLLNRG